MNRSRLSEKKVECPLLPPEWRVKRAMGGDLLGVGAGSFNAMVALKSIQQWHQGGCHKFQHANTRRDPKGKRALAESGFLYLNLGRLPMTTKVLYVGIIGKKGRFVMNTSKKILALLINVVMFIGMLLMAIGGIAIAVLMVTVKLPVLLYRQFLAEFAVDPRSPRHTSVKTGKCPPDHDKWYEAYDTANPLDRVLLVAEEAWMLPAGYFQREDIQWDGMSSMDLDNHISVHEYGNEQCPLSMLMAGGSEIRTFEFIDELWAHPRYRQAVAHVFHQISRNQVVRPDFCFQGSQPYMAGDVAALLIKSGYGAPTGRVIVRAIKEGLVGAPRDDTYLQEGHRYLIDDLKPARTIGHDSLHDAEAAAAV